MKSVGAVPSLTAYINLYAIRCSAEVTRDDEGGGQDVTSHIVVTSLHYHSKQPHTTLFLSTPWCSRRSIVGDLDGDESSLKSTCLGARAFVGRSQTNLFREIEILHPAEGNAACPRLLKLLESSPHLAVLIEELRIILGVTNPELRRSLALSGAVTPSAWIRADRTLQRILPGLSLKRISIIEPFGARQKGLDWNNFHQPLKSALASVFSSPALESVTLRGFVINSPVEFLSIFSEAASLKALAISGVYFEPPFQKHGTWPNTQLWRPSLPPFMCRTFTEGRYAPISGQILG
ncbi:hypothetical protein FB45DRAFT_1006951 [Roridomyces roridus]|uniref:Uncharacterized protein n=1 Tax=Roridomyces roridus TaxID=1738132 RepID=A0AAD7BGT7_9AGAR|nr:hypothetical protein FB45DRAFT_1006951 [Roridomyces roridus]